MRHPPIRRTLVGCTPMRYKAPSWVVDLSRSELQNASFALIDIERSLSAAAATKNDASTGVKANFMQHLASTVVTVQYGDLAVVVPSLDISRPVSIRGCFRFSVAEGQLGLVSDELPELYSTRGSKRHCGY
jgi:hypothetical protein